MFGKALTDVFIRKLMSQPHSLGLMLNRLSVHDGRFELLDDATVDSVALRTSCQNETDRNLTRWNR